MCVACRTTRAKRDLTRVVRTPDGRVMLDPTGRLAGRGAYLCADRSCWERSLAKGALSRALATPLPTDIRDLVEATARDRTISSPEGGTSGTE